jgi:hypothetical protein
MNDFPAGKAQQQVLAALGMTGFYTAAGANEVFESLGLMVRAVRQGRASVPQITLKSRYAGGWNEGGDGDSWRAYGDLTADQMRAISAWLVKK